MRTPAGLRRPDSCPLHEGNFHIGVALNDDLRSGRRQDGSSSRRRAVCVGAVAGRAMERSGARSALRSPQQCSQSAAVAQRLPESVRVRGSAARSRDRHKSRRRRALSVVGARGFEPPASCSRSGSGQARNRDSRLAGGHPSCRSRLELLELTNCGAVLSRWWDGRRCGRGRRVSAERRHRDRASPSTPPRPPSRSARR